jgi:hypothetical protein
MASAIRARSSDVDLTLRSHTGPRHVNRRIRGRTHGSTPTTLRTRQKRFFLHQRGRPHMALRDAGTQPLAFLSAARRRAMLVAAPVSSMKTSLLGSSSSWSSNQASRRFRMSGRSRSAACADFF